MIKHVDGVGNRLRADDVTSGPVAAAAAALLVGVAAAAVDWDAEESAFVAEDGGGAVKAAAVEVLRMGRNSNGFVLLKKL